MKKRLKTILYNAIRILLTILTAITYPFWIKAYAVNGFDMWGYAVDIMRGLY